MKIYFYKVKEFNNNVLATERFGILDFEYEDFKIIFKEKCMFVGNNLLWHLGISLSNSTRNCTETLNQLCQLCCAFLGTGCLQKML